MVRAGRELRTSVWLAFMVHIKMARSIKVHQKKRGRPATGRDPLVSARIPQRVIDEVEEWAAKSDGGLTRSKAISRLVELGLKAKGKAR